VIAEVNALIGTEKSGISVVGLLYGLGVMVLLVSSLNYANLATAQATLRAKEIGLRRVVGAKTSGLALQYIGEAALLSFTAAMIALTLMSLVTAAMQSSDAVLVVAASFFMAQLPIVLLSVIAIAIVAGAYPAFVLSRISVADALRAGKVRAGPRFVPALLVAVQFAATSFLVITIMVMSAQHANLEQAAFTRDEDPLLVVSNNLTYSGVTFETLQAELSRQPHVRAVSASMQSPWSIAGALMPLSTSPGESARRLTVCNNLIQSNYLSTLDIKLIAGRDLDATRANDVVKFADVISGKNRAQSYNGASVLIDRAFADQTGWSLSEALDKELYLWVPGTDQTSPPIVRVVGVVESKPLRLLGLGATTNMYALAPDSALIPLIRIDKDNLKAGMAEVSAVWEKLAPNVALKRKFADEMLDESLRLFTAITLVFRFVAILALVIAVLGLVGMSLHIIGRRTHEIGVRKTLGASVAQILQLLLKDFSKPVLVANLVAWPLAFGAMSIYLSIFVTRTSLSWTPFALSLLLTLMIAWGAVIVQATRAARVNPATVLRYE
jgi:putative ABC transport system permease protein